MVLALCTLALVGCTLTPRYQRPAAPVPAEFPGTTAPAAAPVAEMSWRSFIPEERLTRLIEIALASNRDLRVAVLNVEQSRAQYRISYAQVLPSIGANGSFVRQQTQGATSQTASINIGVSAYELDLFGRLRSLTQQALEQYLATAEARRSAQIALVAETATQYFQLREAEEQLALARQTLAIVQESYDINKSLFAAGATGELDMRAAEGQVQTARINVIAYQRQITQAQNALQLLLGQPIPAGLPLARPFAAAGSLADIPAGLPSDLIERRPDILQAEHALKSANANIGAARAAFFPVISMTGTLGKASPQLSRLFDSGTDVWSFAPQVNLPLFTWGANTARLKAARIAAQVGVASYEKTIQTAFREVADALVASASYASQVEAEELAIAAQSRRFELASLRYRHGDDTYLNLLLAQRDLYAAQQGHLESERNGLSARIALFRALGGGWR